MLAFLTEQVARKEGFLHLSQKRRVAKLSLANLGTLSRISFFFIFVNRERQSHKNYPTCQDQVSISGSDTSNSAFEFGQTFTRCWWWERTAVSTNYAGYLPAFTMQYTTEESWQSRPSVPQLCTCRHAYAIVYKFIPPVDTKQAVLAAILFIGSCVSRCLNPHDWNFA